MPNTQIKSDHEQLVTIADVNALIQSNTKLVTLLEQINDNLEPLKDIRRETAEVLAFIRSDLADSVVKKAIVEKQLDITNEQSKLAIQLKNIADTTKSVAEKLNKVVWVIILSVTLLGGLRVVSDWILPSGPNQISKNIHHYIDSSGRAYILDATGDTLWVSKNKPQN